MEHNLTLAGALDRFLIVDDETGNRVSTMELSEGLLELGWDFDDCADSVRTFPGDQIVRTDGHYLYAVDEGDTEYAFRAYTIVNFDDDLPPQSC